jgi:hypothetical protein
VIAIWAVAQCSFVEVHRRFRGVYCLHNQGPIREVSIHSVTTANPNILLLLKYAVSSVVGSSTHLWNVGLLPQDYTAHHRKLSSSHSPTWESEISQRGVCWPAGRVDCSRKTFFYLWGLAIITWTWRRCSNLVILFMPSAVFYTNSTSINTDCTRPGISTFIKSLPQITSKVLAG